MEELRFCYEAGPTGYALYWQLSKLGAPCVVVAPTLVPVKAGDRVKTDRRDALKLARNHRAGELTAVWVPDAEHEALRDLVRAREAAKKDQLRARHRLSKFLLRHGRRAPQGIKPWTVKYLEWVKRDVHFQPQAQEVTLLDYLHEVEHAAARIARLDAAIEEAVKLAPAKMRAVIAALQALRGIAEISAVTVVAELGEVTRFRKARQLMGYGGIVASENSSGERNAASRHHEDRQRPLATRGGGSRVGLPAPTQRGVHACENDREPLSEEIKEMAWKAQHRLHARYGKLLARGKPKGVVVTAVGTRIAGLYLGHRVQAEAEQQESLRQRPRKEFTRKC